MSTVKKSKKNLKFTSIAWLLAGIIFAVTVLINIAVSFFDVELDMSPNQLYTLNDTTVEYVENLDKEVDIYLLMELEKIKNASDADEMMAFTTMMEQYSEFDKINLYDIDPDTNPDVVNELNPDGVLNISSGDVIVKCGDAVRKVPAKEFYIYQGEYDESGNFIAESAYFQGENLISGAIKSVVEDITPSVYFLTGHGEKAVDEYYTTFKRNLQNVNYAVKELNLASEESVPEDAAIIIVAAPKTDITADEKKKLDAFMDNGGNLSLLMSPNQSNEDYENLVEIMHEYCLGMDYNMITETEATRHVSGDESTIMVELYDLNKESSSDSGDLESLVNDTLVIDNENVTDLTSTLIEEMSAYIPYMPPSRSFFNYAGDNYASLNICPLIQTYETAESIEYGGNETFESVMAAPFYLAGYSEDPTRNNSKLVVMGNAEFVDDEHLESGYTIVPLNLYLTTISWMADSNIDMNIPSRARTYDYMTLESKEDTNFVLGIIVAAPIVVALAGVLVWLKRRNS